MAVVASLVLNAALVKLLRLDMIVAPRGVAVQRPVALAPLSAEQWAANRAVRSGARPPPTAGTPIVPPKVVKPPEPKESGQVVALGPGKSDEKAPEDAKLLAERNSRVEKETLSRQRRAGYENAAPRPSAQGSNQAQAQRSETAAQQRAAQGLARGQGTENRRGKPGEDAVEIPDQRGRPKLALKMDAFGETMPSESKPDVKGNSGRIALGNPSSPDDQGEGTAAGTRGGKIDVSQLKPSAAFYDRLAGGPSPDHVEGVVEGDETLLNAREFKYASYLNRVKEGIATHWDPARAMAARDPDGTRFPPSDRITVIVFSIDERGAVRNVEVVGGSGLEFIDRAAVSAIQEAQPFINPPHAMFGGREEIPMRFVFRFTMGNVGGFRRNGRVP
ncbi:MAG TPA: TonB family protein [Anaeromyxobacteraceae bacterium]|nr:TonB family protein [Anaeromyxobacteraceae bacterium]